uniref:CAU/MBL1b family subclass B3 metallo-beta-lactamase n=1 Tax=uncultured Caulobacter sp. TaxID=158749 RepID=UPI0025D21EE0|nr:CAU/MBL1b family subclass B3 metallo-beta-lactamase [uncultured Caulobacter sp.]
MKRFLILALLATPAFAQQAPADDNANWVRPIKPYRVVGNIYYVGSEGLPAWLITSSQGHILLDSGPSAEGGKLIERSIQQLGFQLADVKILINTHAHYDHAGGLAQLKLDTGAKLWASRLDEPALEAGRHIGGNSNGPTPFPAVKVDKAFGDGQKLKLGENTLIARLTPGHSIGCTTWTTQVTEKGRPLNVTFNCSLSVAGNQLVGNKEHRNIVADYRASFAAMRAIPTDVMLPSHEEQGNLLAKRQKMLRGDPNAFVDPTELGRLVDGYETRFNQELARQQAAAPGAKR